MYTQTYTYIYIHTDDEHARMHCQSHRASADEGTAQTHQASHAEEGNSFG